MAPKKGKKAAPPPEPDPFEQLPPDLPSEPPFPVDWRAVCAIVVTPDDWVNEAVPKYLSDATKTARVLSLAKVMERLKADKPDSECTKMVLEAEQTAAQAGRPGVFPATVLAAVAEQQFQRDRELAWKLELVARSTAVQDAQTAVTAAAAQLQHAESQLQAAVTERELAAAAEQEAEGQADAAEGEAGELEGGVPADDPQREPGVDADGADSEEGEEGGDEEEEGEDPVMRQLQTAVDDAESGLGQAKAKLEEAEAGAQQPLKMYSAYWVKDVGDDWEALMAARSAGIPIRAVFWLHAPPEEETEPQPQPPAVPALFAAAVAAGGRQWDADEAQIAAQELLVGSQDGILGIPVAHGEGAPDSDAADASGAEPPVGFDGRQELGRAFYALRQAAEAYDAWRSSCCVFELAAEAPMDTALYQRLMEEVPANRESVALILHAMLEQVCQNVVAPEACRATVLAQDTQERASRALDSALSMLEVPDQSLYPPGLQPPAPDYTLVMEGDTVMQAAVGLNSGYVQALRQTPAAASNRMVRDLDSCGGAAQGLLDLAAVEQHMLNLLPLPQPDSAGPPEPSSTAATAQVGEDAIGNGRPDAGRGDGAAAEEATEAGADECGAAAAEAATPQGEGGGSSSHQWHQPHWTAVQRKAVEEAVLLAHSNNVSLHTFSRYRMLAALGEMLPAPVKAAHAEPLLKRRHQESLSADVLKQLLAECREQYPEVTVQDVYLDGQELTLVAFHGGCCHQHQRTSLPAFCAFGRYWQLLASSSSPCSGLAKPQLGEYVYGLPAADATIDRLVHFVYPTNGSVLSAAGGTGSRMMSLQLHAAKASFRANAGEVTAGISDAAVLSIARTCPEAASKALNTPDTAEQGASQQLPPTVEPVTHQLAASLALCCGTPSGVQLQLGCDGTVWMKRPPGLVPDVPYSLGVDMGSFNPGGDLAAVATGGEEEWRCVLQDGSVLVSRKGRGLCLLHADGNVSERVAHTMVLESDGSSIPGWSGTNNRGRRWQLPAKLPEPKPAMEEEAEAAPDAPEATEEGAEQPPPAPPVLEPLHLPAVECAERLDPDTGSTILSRELSRNLALALAHGPKKLVAGTLRCGYVMGDVQDGTMVIQYPSGDRLVLHADGTRISHFAGGSFLVEAEGLPAVQGDTKGLQVVPAPGLRVKWMRSSPASLPSGASTANSSHLVAHLGEELVLVGMADSVAMMAAATQLPAALEALGRIAVERAALRQAEAAEGKAGSPAEQQADANADTLPNSTDAEAAEADGNEADAEQEESMDPKPQEEEGQEGIARQMAALPGCEGCVFVDLSSNAACVCLAPDEEVGVKPTGELVGWPPIPPPVEEAPPPCILEEAAEAVPELSEEPAEASGVSGEEQEEEEEEGGSGEAHRVQEEEVEAVGEAAVKPEEEVAVAELPKPAAPQLPPRVFVVDPSLGSGYEVLDPQAFARYQAAHQSQIGGQTDVLEVPGMEPGTRLHNFLMRYSPVSLAVPEIPVAAAPQLEPPPTATSFQMLRRPSRLVPPAGDRPALVMPRLASVSGVRAERGCVQPPPTVATFRQVLEVPELEDSTIQTLFQAVEDVMSWHEAQAAVGPDSYKVDDERSVREQQEAASISATVQKMMRAKEEEAAKRQAELAAKATADELAHEINVYEGAMVNAAAAMANEGKGIRVTVPGPFDSCPKRPVPGALLNYFETEEAGLTMQGLSAVHHLPDAHTCGAASLAPRVDAVKSGSSFLPGSDGVYCTPGITGAASFVVPDRTDAAAQHLFIPNGRANLLPPVSSPEIGAVSEAGPYCSPGPAPGGSGSVDAAPGTELACGPAGAAPQPGGVLVNEEFVRKEGDALRFSNTCAGRMLHARNPLAPQFALTPERLDLGKVPEGEVVHRTACLQNVSAERARFSVLRPRMPLRVIHKPGPVAAGMKATLTIEFHAKAEGDFEGMVQVNSETSILRLPITATVMPAAAVGAPAPVAADAALLQAPSA